MKKRLLVTAMGAFMCIGNVSADDDNRRGGLRAFKQDVAQQFDAVNSQINLNQQAIQSNSVSIGANSSAIAANTAAIANIPVPQTIDFKLYEGTASTKTYALTGSGFCGNTELRSFTRVDNGVSTDLRIDRKRSNAGVTCHHKVFGYNVTADKRELLYRENRNPGSGNLGSTDTLTDPITRVTSTMQMGVTLGDASPITRTSVGGTPSFFSALVESNTVVDIEDVTVPAGSYSACLKLHTFRTSSGFGAFNRIAWLCPGMGEVKRIQVDPGSYTPRVWEMTNITY